MRLGDTSSFNKRVCGWILYKIWKRTELFSWLCNSNALHDAWLESFSCVYVISICLKLSGILQRIQDEIWLRRGIQSTCIQVCRGFAGRWWSYNESLEIDMRYFSSGIWYDIQPTWYQVGPRRRIVLPEKDGGTCPGIRGSWTSSTFWGLQGLW